ncbi:MAG TPA: GNAT family N-acetyltransferase [Acidimicrobiales bacterium]|nr:GNAT family N-acetyltransferase [Acidimicrobiales bacterium]
MTAALDVTHHADDHRYVLTDGDEAVGLLAYRPVGRPGTDLVDVYTTQISPARRGQGLGEVLVREALDDLRRRGTAVKASCWYVADFLRDNPEYHDLREGADRPVATKTFPDERTSPEAAHEAHANGVAGTDPVAAGGDPGRPPSERA